MRQGFAAMMLLVLANCGGSGGGAGGGNGGGGIDAWREAVSDVTKLGLEAGTSPLMPNQTPQGKVGMSGAFGARIGGTNEALFGGAHMIADFDAARVDGWVDDLALYEVSLDVPLAQTQPIKIEDLMGSLNMEGAIELLPTDGEGIWFDAGYRGTLTGENTEIRFNARTDRGAFLTSDGKLVAFGDLYGSVTRVRDGLSRVFVLREGKIYVVAP